MSASLVGSEMCIRDRPKAVWRPGRETLLIQPIPRMRALLSPWTCGAGRCLLYTSDAADDM
eukprot:6221178-Alexandrium_andersonii.AAC.1